MSDVNVSLLQSTTDCKTDNLRDAMNEISQNIQILHPDPADVDPVVDEPPQVEVFGNKEMLE